MRVSDRFKAGLVAGITGALLVGTVAHSQEAEPVASQLTPRLRELLQQEMQAVLSASHEILDALVTADHAVVADRAQRIRESFIMEQSLTEQDKADLTAAVPPDFIELDEAFHSLAASLAEAGRAGDEALEARYFAEMVESCVACHSRFATDVFPSFGE